MKTRLVLDEIDRILGEKIIADMTDYNNLSIQKLEFSYLVYAQNKRKTSALLACLEYKPNQNSLIFYARDVQNNKIVPMSTKRLLIRNINDLYNDETYQSFITAINDRLSIISSAIGE